MKRNSWTAQMLANDYHVGDATQAALIVAENGNKTKTCGQCGREAFYKHTIGSYKCSCGAVRCSTPHGVKWL